MSDYELCREEYKEMQDMWWKDPSLCRERGWALMCWESKWPQELRDRVKKSFSWWG